MASTVLARGATQTELALPKAPKKKGNGSGDPILDYVRNAHRGEKKTEAGIKHWFEQNIEGHTTEDPGMSKLGVPDGYTPGWLALELKGKQTEWSEGLFEGLARKELSFRLLVVAAHNTLLVFPGLSADLPEDWSDEKKKEWARLIKATHATAGSPSKVGKLMASQYKKREHRLVSFSIFSWSPSDEGSLFPASQSQDEAFASFKNLVTSYDVSKARIEITPKNFSKILGSLLPFFDEDKSKKFEVVHGFFRCMSYWNQKHIPVISDEPNEQDRVVLGAGHFEGLVPDSREAFVKAIQRYEVRNPDKARFYAHYDTAIDVVDPEYRANHGIYFTNEYLARLAITLSEQHIGSLGDKYIVFDPACGSGNLVTSWNHHLDLRHKVVSEISPVLLKAFELRFQNKSSEKRKGFTIVPKTSTGEGLNFVSQSAADYLKRINTELKESGHKLNKPLAVVCNPPYRNQKDIKNKFYSYDVHESVTSITGPDAGKELFACFLAQISEICRLAEEHRFPPNSIVLLFTQSGWLTRKSSYNSIRTHFLQRFKERLGFVVTSSEFFDVGQSWPIVVSLWEYVPEANLDSNRSLEFQNYLDLKRADLKELAEDSHPDFDDLSKWGSDDLFRGRLLRLLKEKTKGTARFNIKVEKLKDNIAPQAGDGNAQINSALIERGAILGGLCFFTDEQKKEREEKFNVKVKPVYEGNKDRQNGSKIKLPSFIVQGHPDGQNVGFTDGKQPFRTNRPFKNDGNRLFFLMDTRFIKMQTSQCFSGVPAKRGHVLENLDAEGKTLIIGYAMAHSLAQNVPDQFNQYDMWLPQGNAKALDKLFQLSAAFLYAHNSCIECEIPGDHPVRGAPRAFVVNPLSPVKGTFWQSKLKQLIEKSSGSVASDAVEAVDEFYKTWKRWIQDHSAYKAKAKLSIYNHQSNRVPSDGWGIFQIDQEIKLLPDEVSLQKACEKRKEAIKRLKEEIRRVLVDELKYWEM